MRMKLAVAALLIAQCLSACGPNVSRNGSGYVDHGRNGGGPSDADFEQAIQARHPGHPIVAARLDECHDATAEGNSVQQCGFCFVAVGLLFSNDTIDHGAYLAAVRRSGSVTFTRAAPASERSEHARNEGEAWVASNIRHDASMESAPLSNDLMTRAGHHRRPGVGTFVKWMFQRPTSLGRLGEVAAPVARSFATDEDLRSEAADLVGACERENGQWAGRPAPAAPGHST
jgi:hypothetical protein